ncbi:MAG: S1/P1 Nuclease [Deltaproteobacteria bacterium]|nr:MAG: S1/P1 Nuclease [Deltaproteobacteria bacterium]
MKTLITMVILMMSTNLWAWGPTGHRVVGEVAEKYLKNKVLKKITKILDGESLARVSNWPDKIKSDPEQYSYTFSWHYTSWPAGQDHYDPHTASGSLLTSLQKQIDILRKRDSTKDEKAFAIKFIVHLMGDLHQPLHVGNGHDHGGNSCRVLFHKEEVNLHKLWDESMIDFTRLSFTELSRFVDVRAKGDISKLQSGTLLQWMTESRDLRDSVYPSDVTLSSKGKNSLPNYCDRDLNLPTEQLPKLGYGYSYKHMPVVEERLFLAGIRLAKILNESF